MSLGSTAKLIPLPCKWDTTWSQMWFLVRASGFQERGECTEGGTHECSPTEKGSTNSQNTHWEQANKHSTDLMHLSAQSSSVTWTAGAAERASVKQIMHMSSASCFRQPVFLSQPCRQGKQLSSFLTPPQGCPHGWVLLQASLEYSCGSQQRNWWGFLKCIQFSGFKCELAMWTNLAVWVGADTAHRRQLGSISRATEPAGVRAAGGWFTYARTNE